jgi:hypothetical protein
MIEPMNLARSCIEPKWTPSLRQYWRKACCIARSAGRHGGDFMFDTNSAQSKGIGSDCTKRTHRCRRASAARRRLELTVPKRDRRRRGQCDAGGDPPIDPNGSIAFSSEACPRLDPGVDPARVKKTRVKTRIWSFGSDSIRTDALPGRAGILDDRAEQLLALAVELHHLHLLVDAVTVGEVLATIPGSDRLPVTFFKLAACRMMFSRVRSSPERAYPEIMLNEKVEWDDDKSSRSTPARAESARAPPAPPAHKGSAGSLSLRRKRRPRSRKAEKIL